MKLIPLANPNLIGNEATYVQDCLESGWISGSGEYVERFEDAWAKECGARYGISCCNGTAALHLALLALGVGPGDKVIVPDLTFVATANAVTYCGATPVFCDVDLQTWCIQPQRVRELTSYCTKAILPVHLYGHPAAIETLSINRPAYDGRLISLLDDAAQAHGASYAEGRKVGTGTEATAWSFHAAKILTTGEGGMVTTDNPDLAAKMRLLRDHGMDPSRRYWHPIIGYNYRMTNLHAAIGLAQVERFAEIAKAREGIIWSYREALSDIEVQTSAIPMLGKNVCWLFGVVLPTNVHRDQVITTFAEQGIATRPFFHPLHTLPPYADARYEAAAFPVSSHLARQGICLPAHATLTEEDIVRIISTLKQSLVTCR